MPAALYGCLPELLTWLGRLLALAFPALRLLTEVLGW